MYFRSSGCVTALAVKNFRFNTTNDSMSLSGRQGAICKLYGVKVQGRERNRTRPKKNVERPDGEKKNA